VVVVQNKIKTVIDQAPLKGISYLIKDGKGWLIEELLITDKQIDLTR